MSSSAERLLVAALMLAAAGARADVFSPGPLAQSHADLEGLKNCTKCHVAGGKLSNDTCLACHKTTKQSIVEHRGIHGRLPPAELTCNKCHPEHLGRDANLLWGPKGQKGFDHAKTGYPLKGKHAKVECAQCHTDRLIRDPAVRAARAKKPKLATFLGLPTQCAQCHFDEHRGQLSTKCANCHTEASWKPSPRFSHAKTDFPLLGKHAGVKCAKCHPSVTDGKAHTDAPMPPYSETFMRMSPVAHASCTDCHKDPHEGRLGANCTACHTVNDWKEVKGVSGERAFHEKTRYPLRGAHATVDCKSCHGPFPGVRAVFKGLKFDHCSDCHVDAHLGELGSPPPACDACHSLASFRPATYEPAAHIRYPLEGAHFSTPCSGCHRSDAALESRAAPIRAFLEKRRRKDQVVLTRFRVPGDTRRCDTCHADTHRGQFAARVKQAGCADCHRVASFAQVQFDHNRESSFRLTGAHENAACSGCHVLDLAGVIRYKPLAGDCASCHADPHAAQFADARTRATDCARCHPTSDWKRTTFVHWPPFTAFVLDGRHASVECAACHPDVDVGDGVRARHYRGIPTTCAGCHFDIHRGAFRGFTGGFTR
jgi:Cytochrome c3